MTTTVKRALGRLKASLTMTEKFMHKLEHEEIIGQVQYNQLEARLAELPGMREKFQTIYDSYDDETDEIIGELMEFETRIYDCSAALKAIMARLPQVKAESSESINSIAANNTTNLCGVELPKIKLPEFNGEYELWIPFRDTFLALIHNNEQIPEMSKYYYLTSCLQDEAKALVAGLSPSGANYAVAWELLTSRYDNVRLILNDHVNQFLNPPSYVPNCHRSLRKIIDHFNLHLKVIKALPVDVPLEEILLSHILLGQLDSTLCSSYEESVQGTEVPPLARLLEFLERKCKTFEMLAVKVSSPSTRPEARKDTPSSACVLCNKEHPLGICSRFQGMSIEQRERVVKANKLCNNCLKVYSRGHACSSYLCRKCGARHHTLLHYEPAHTNQTRGPPQNHRSAQVNMVNTRANQPSSSIMPTASVLVVNSKYPLTEVRAVLDTATNYNLISQALVKRLELPTKPFYTYFEGVATMKTPVTKVATVTIQSRATTWSKTLQCLVAPEISITTPGTYTNTREWNIPKDICMADPKFNVPGPIDLILAVDTFFEALLPEQIKPQTMNIPIIQNTQLGWVFGGRLSGNSVKPNVNVCQVSSWVSVQGVHKPLIKYRKWDKINQKATELEKGISKKGKKKVPDFAETSDTAVSQPKIDYVANKASKSHDTFQRYVALPSCRQQSAQVHQANPDSTHKGLLPVKDGIHLEAPQPVTCMQFPKPKRRLDSEPKGKPIKSLSPGRCVETASTPVRKEHGLKGFNILNQACFITIMLCWLSVLLIGALHCVWFPSSIRLHSFWHDGGMSSIGGQLVLIKDEITPPSSWPLAMVVQTFPDKAGRVRVTTLKTQNGECRRPITKLVPLLDD